MVVGVHSVIIWTDDLDRMLAFYQQLLAREPEMESPEFAIFGGNGALLAVGRHSQVQGRARDPNRVMIDLRVDDCRAEYQRLRGQGVQFSREPEEEGGVIVATFADPDGNVLQLFEETRRPG